MPCRRSPHTSYQSLLFMSRRRFYYEMASVGDAERGRDTRHYARAFGAVYSDWRRLIYLCSRRH